MRRGFVDKQVWQDVEELVNFDVCPVTISSEIQSETRIETPGHSTQSKKI